MTDWSRTDTWNSVLEQERIDRVIATDVVYDGSPYAQLADLLRAIKDRHSSCQIQVMLPGARGKGQDFLAHMTAKNFTHDFVLLNSSIYRQAVIGDAKESRKWYPGIEELEFRLYSFN